MTSEIDALIAKCEAATGGDRESDAAFHALINGYPFRFENGGTQMFYRHADEKAARWHTAFEAKEGQTVGYVPYTSSLDSIVALIERELHPFYVSFEYDDEPAEPIFSATIMAEIDGRGQEIYGTHDSGPGWQIGLSLTFCTAFLKALRAKRSIDGSAE
jgi:hypothetical protein